MCELCMKKALGLPVKPDRWIVEESQVGTSINVYPASVGPLGIGGTILRDSWGRTVGGTYVSEPGALARFFGDTLNKRLQRARARAQVVVNQENIKVKAEIRFCRRLKKMKASRRPA